MAGHLFAFNDKKTTELTLFDVRSPVFSSSLMLITRCSHSMPDAILKKEEKTFYCA